MACCDEPVARRPPGFAIDYSDLPDETFCCMGRMAYAVAVRALEVVTDKSFKQWNDLNEREKLELGSLAKRILSKTHAPTNQTEAVMEVVLLSMTTNA